MSADKKVPDIRFKGFSGEWNCLILGENANFTKGQGYSKGDLVKNGHPIILYGRLYTKYQTIITNVDTFVIEKNKSVKSIGGEVIVPASGESPEDISRASVVSEPNIILGGDLNIVLPNKKISPAFLALAISMGRLKKILSSKAQGKSVVHIRNSDLADLNTILPFEKVEQTAIGNYFQKLDSLINQHQQKHDKLNNIKKAMLEKMFPKQGETVPEIRFKGFSGKWEEKELGELSGIVRGASPRPIEDPKWFDSQSSVGWLRIRDVTDQDGRINYLEQRISKLGQEKTRVLHDMHLLLSIAASVGKPVINYVETGVHDGFLIFKNPLFELEFMYQWLKSFEVRWQQYGQPGSQINLNSDIVKSQSVVIPSTEEQTAIGNYFQKLDMLIHQQQQQITKLNNIKQACLNKMFI
ncbi:restriction endonuclease subunit S [Proteus mirabilis]|nr:restriction endonuclease subunit S [Proteus mirabilis]MBG2768345.1 restriction endonuclease subunit S [Proteus mirabilis]